ncbi:MAG: hypothetical protein KGY99_00270 [Phycisphaerae bacterium]|nr:hypothetical protein [Phycisphaerae bacterium]
MRRHLGILILAGIVLVVLLALVTMFTVGSEEIVIVKRFGAIHRVYDGRGGAGLHFKLPYPFERIVTYDARIRTFRDTYEPVQMNDGTNIMVGVYCGWRIGDPIRFNQKTETIDRARDGLRTLIRAEKKAKISSYVLSQLLNTDLDAMKLDDVEEDIAREVAAKAAADYGIEVVALGIERNGLQKQVAKTVITAMEQERSSKAEQYVAEGKAEATAIRKRAEQAKETILAFARKRAAEIRSEGDQIAASYYEGFSAEPEFAMFLRWLEAMETELQGRTTLLLDGSRQPALLWFRDGLPAMKPETWKTPPGTADETARESEGP